jgi:hypothetical protein
MAFISHELVSAGGSKDAGEYGFEVVWRLFSGSTDDGPDAALDYVDAEIAQRKSTYRLEAVPSSYASSESSSSPSATVDQNSRAELVNVSVEKVKGSGDGTWVWLATLKYEELEGAGGEGEDTGGNNVTAPTDFAAEIDIQTVQYVKPCEAATYVSGFTGVAHTKCNTGTELPIVTSALILVDPAPEVDDHRWVIRIKKNLATLDCDTVRCNVVNSAEVKISYRGVSKTIPALCGKTRDISAVPVKHPVIGWYVQVQLFIEVNDDTWRINQIDAGFSARAMVDDPDGDGGVIYDDSRAFVDDIAPQRRLGDKYGTPCSEPQLLDGNGQPQMKFTDNTGDLELVYGVWKYYPEEDFGAWPILADMID